MCTNHAFNVGLQVFLKTKFSIDLVCVCILFPCLRFGLCQFGTTWRPPPPLPPQWCSQHTLQVASNPTTIIKRVSKGHLFTPFNPHQWWNIIPPTLWFRAKFNITFVSPFKKGYLCGNGNLLQYSCLENSTDRGAQWGCKESDRTEQLSTNQK